MTCCCIKRVVFYWKQKSRFICIYNWPSRKALKCLLQSIWIVRFIISSICYKKKCYKILFLPRCYNDEIKFNTKTHFYIDEKLLNYFAWKMIWLNILQNVTIYLFKCFVSYIMTYISILLDRSKFLVLHNFTKCFSGF